MFAALLALLASALYGIADFLGGSAARRAPVLGVAALSQGVGLAGLLVAILFLPAAHPSTPDLAWGAASGVAGGLGVVLFYRALSIGRMSVVAPITAVCGLAIPVLAGLALGERPGALPLLGVVLAAGAVTFLAQGVEPEEHAGGAAAADEPSPDGPALAVAAPPMSMSRVRVSRASLAAPLLAVLAGVIIGLFYVFLERTSTAAGLTPLVAGRSVSVAGMLVLGLSSRRVHQGASSGDSMWSLTVPRSVLAIVAAAGLIDILANICYLVAVREGLLSIIAPLASLYPAATVLLALGVLGERLHRPQTVGLAVAAAAVLLMTAG
jgi:uncharacterized membrane protein